MEIKKGKGHFRKKINFLGSTFKINLNSDHLSPLPVPPFIPITSISHLYHHLASYFASKLTSLSHSRVFSKRSQSDLSNLCQIQHFSTKSQTTEYP